MIYLGWFLRCFMEKRKTENNIETNFLPYVSYPSQYIGAEMNIIRKDWNSCDVKIALCFPDTYSVGSSSLAIQIIYNLLNSMDGVLCERVFCPWVDAGNRMREIGLSLYSLESYRSVREFDILAFSVGYELLYTNILEVLDLAGIEIWSDKRSEREPLVIIGGSQANNPEPIADFVDLIVVGEAEKSLPEFIKVYRELKKKSKKKELVTELAKRFDWLYAPSAYEVKYNSDGTIKEIQPKYMEMPEKIKRVYVENLNAAPFPTKPIVPIHKTVHSRINIEIMRGCPHKCRFCQEGYTRKPVRLRSKENIIRLAKESFQNTGITEISLSSLSSTDYPKLEELFWELNKYFAPRYVSIALPSLRIDKQLKIIPEQISRVRKQQLTIAIEAASEQLRGVIGKNINLKHLKPAVMEAYKRGWSRVKLYFIVGLPTETEEDIVRIVEITREIADWRREVANSPAQITASISFFVPKPHTPFQWIGQKSLKYYEYAKNLIKSKLGRKDKNLKFNFHNGERSKIEAVFARGDRRLSSVIYAAWKLGTKFDSWDETFKFDAYLEAFEKTGLSLEYYAERKIPLTEILPWEHIEVGLDKRRLTRELEMAVGNEY